MILRLSRGQFEASRLVASERLIGYLDHAVPVGDRDLEVVVPYAGALTLLDAFELKLFTRKQGKRKRYASRRDLSALHAVARAVNAWDAHPAFHGAKLPGGHTTVLAAWRTGSAFSPVPGGEFCVLVPHAQQAAILGGLVTFWAPGTLRRCDTEPLDEAEHLGWSSSTSSR